MSRISGKEMKVSFGCPDFEVPLGHSDRKTTIEHMEVTGLDLC